MRRLPVVAVLALASLLLAACSDTLTQNCPPLAHPPVLTVAAASNPCQAKAGETADLLALRVVRVYQRSAPPAPGQPTRFPLRCGNVKGGYLHLLDQMGKGNLDHGDPINDADFDARLANTVEHGTVYQQNNNNFRITAKYNQAESECHNGDWGFRVVVATNAPPFPPPAWKRDGLPVGIITAFRLPGQPSSYP